MSYLIIDIETAPHDTTAYFALDEEKRLEKLNPIDSKIIAIGLRANGENVIFQGENEKEILESFWKKVNEITKGSTLFPIVGFNVTHFDLPFLTARSFVNKVIIVPFLLKQVVDLRDKINAYRMGKTRGKLKEYAKLLGIATLDFDGSDVARLWKNKEYETLKKYLISDLEITDELYQVAQKTQVDRINRW